LRNIIINININIVIIIITIIIVIWSSTARVIAAVEKPTLI
jgi:hypothetical protein